MLPPQFFINEKKPGGRRAFGGGLIDRDRRLKDVDAKILEEMKINIDDVIRTRKKHTMAMYKLGRLCLIFKSQFPHGLFGKILRKYFPYINKRTVERAMKIAKRCDLDTYPVFSAVSVTDLLSITNKMSFTELIEILKENNIDPKTKDCKAEIINKCILLLKLLIKGELFSISIPNIDLKDEIGPNGWSVAIDNGTIIPDREVKIHTKADSNEYIINNVILYVKKLNESREDFGPKLEEKLSFNLISLMNEICETFLNIGSSSLSKSKELDTVSKALKIIISNMKTIDDNEDDGNDFLDEDEDEPARKKTKNKDKPKGKSRLLDDEDDYLDDDEEDEDEPARKKTKNKDKPKGKSRLLDDEDDYLDDDEEDEDEQ